jgi:phage baseplate assembly protein W
MPAEDAFLGTGWSFPPTFDRAASGVVMTSGVEDIERSLEIIFSTALGERVMNPAFGCSLDDMVFEPMNTGNVAYIANLLKTAILYHEPRIDAEAIEVRPDDLEGTLWLSVTYTVRSTNSRFNFVYPFYLTSERR